MSQHPEIVAASHGPVTRTPGPVVLSLFAEQWPHEAVLHTTTGSVAEIEAIKQIATDKGYFIEIMPMTSVGTMLAFLKQH